MWRESYSMYFLLPGFLWSAVCFKNSSMLFHITIAHLYFLLFSIPLYSTIYPFYCWWVFGLFPVFYYDKPHCYKLSIHVSWHVWHKFHRVIFLGLELLSHGVWNLSPLVDNSKLLFKLVANFIFHFLTPLPFLYFSITPAPIPISFFQRKEKKKKLS